MTDKQLKNACEEILKALDHFEGTVEGLIRDRLNFVRGRIEAVRDHGAANVAMRVIFTEAHNLLEKLIGDPKTTAENIGLTNVLYGIRCLIEETTRGIGCDSYQS